MSTGVGETRKIKYIATVNDEALPESIDPDWELEYIDIGNVEAGAGITGTATYRFEDAPSRARRRVRHGDVIISTVRTYLQAIAAIIEPQPNLIVSTGFAVIRPMLDKLDPGFCRYVLRDPSFLAEVERRSVGVSYPAINASDLAAIPVPFPPLDRQRAIADYLDRETAKLDAMVVAKERLLDLLAEKRRALITHAVTRGLNPAAPTKHSGIEWLGEIPKHWSVDRLKFHMNHIEQGWSPQCLNMPAGPDEWGVLKAGCVNGMAFDPDENKTLPPDLDPKPELEVVEGDVLMSRSNTVQLLGSTALVGTVRRKLILCDKLYRLHLNPKTIHKPYLVYLLRSPAGRFEFERDATGASNSMQNIGQDSVKNVWLPIPRLEEQIEIADFIRTQARRFDAISISAQGTVRLLKERRAALIAAAVTGAIDVEAAA
ncbi:restriction endonuclease subunit S [Planctomycetales bacterium ZRK34]|nr:restriction endonuclease subunit S [Planctomycetales bacterium ZRK34]